MFTMQDAIDEGWTGPKARRQSAEAFDEGYQDGMNLREAKQYDGVKAQAYDRGFECGLQEHRRFDWANSPDIGD